MSSIKKWIGAMAIAAIAPAAFAQDTQIPDCWTPDNVAKGEYLVGVEVAQVTKEQLVDVLDKANGKHLNAKGYPLVFTDSIILHVQGVDYGVGEHRLSPEELRAAVEQELTSILSYPGTFVECNGIMSLPTQPEPQF